MKRILGGSAQTYYSTIFLSLLLLGLAGIFSLTIPPHASSEYSDRGDTDLSAGSGESTRWWLSTAMDVNGNFVHDSLERGRDAGDRDFAIYVDLAEAPDRNVLEKLENMGCEISYVCKYIDTICMRNVSYTMIETILSMEEVVFVEEQPYLTVALDTSSRAIKARPSNDYSPKTAWEFGYTGEGIVVAILDTGVDDSHEALRNKFEAGYDCSGNYGISMVTNPDDKNGHGTHCAGVVMGTGDPDQEEGERQYVGVAPGARLVDVKVLTDLGGNLGDHLIRGMEWCIENKDRFSIDVLSISVGNRASGDDGTNANARTANAAVEAGLVVVAAAGNDGPDNDGFSSVAAADKAITVGALSNEETVDRKDDEIADYSNRGPRKSDSDHDEVEELKPDVVAPGTDIMSCMYSARPVGLLTGYQVMTGTSMACPHVAGLTALMLEAKPELNSSQIKNILKATAEKMGKTYDGELSEKYSREYGFGLVDAYEALKETLADYQTVTITSIKNDDYLGDEQTLTGITTNDDPGAIQLVEVRIDEGPWMQVSGTYTWSHTFDTRDHKNGRHSIYARCYNGRNYSDEDRVNVYFNNVRLTVENPDNDEIVYGKVIYIGGKIMGLTVDRIDIRIGSVTGFKANITRDGNLYLWEFEWKTDGFPEKVYELKFTPSGDNVYGDGITLKLEFKRDMGGEEDSSTPLPGIPLVILLIITISFLMKTWEQRRAGSIREQYRRHGEKRKEEKRRELR